MHACMCVRMCVSGHLGGALADVPRVGIQLACGKPSLLQRPVRACSARGTARVRAGGSASHQMPVAGFVKLVVDRHEGPWPARGCLLHVFASRASFLAFSRLWGLVPERAQEGKGEMGSTLSPVCLRHCLNVLAMLERHEDVVVALPLVARLVVEEGVSRKVYAWARGTPEERREVQKLAQRCAPWVPDSRKDAQGVVALGYSLPPELTASILKTVRYGWRTSRRVQDDVLECHFCGAHGEDRQEHYMVCVAMWGWAGDRLGTRVVPEASDGHNITLREL